MIRTVQSVKPKVGHSGLTTLMIVELLLDPRKRNKRQLAKKEFHALVNTQWKGFIKGRDNCSKKAKDSNEFSVTSIDSSDSEE